MTLQKSEKHSQNLSVQSMLGEEKKLKEVSTLFLLLLDTTAMPQPAAAVRKERAVKMRVPKRKRPKRLKW